MKRNRKGAQLGQQSNQAKQNRERSGDGTITCPHCRYERPESQPNCPHCGYPWPWLNEKNTGHDSKT